MALPPSLKVSGLRALWQWSAMAREFLIRCVFDVYSICILFRWWFRPSSGSQDLHRIFSGSGLSEPSFQPEHSSGAPSFLSAEAVLGLWGHPRLQTLFQLLVLVLPRGLSCGEVSLRFFSRQTSWTSKWNEPTPTWINALRIVCFISFRFQNAWAFTSGVSLCRMGPRNVKSGNLGSKVAYSPTLCWCSIFHPSIFVFVWVSVDILMLQWRVKVWIGWG